MTTTDATSPEFTEWLTRNPQPALQDLVQRYSGYHRVPADAWTQFDLDIVDWQARRIAANVAKLPELRMSTPRRAGVPRYSGRRMLSGSQTITPASGCADRGRLGRERR
jgi:hypothetical protein